MDDVSFREFIIHCKIIRKIFIKLFIDCIFFFFMVYGYIGGEYNTGNRRGG